MDRNYRNEVSSRGFPCVRYVEPESEFLTNFDIDRMPILSKLGRQCADGSDPSSLILLKGINAGLKRCGRALLLEGVISLRFGECAAGYINSIFGGVGRFLGDGSLPNPYGDCEESSDYKPFRKSGNSRVRFDLRAGEFMLLDFAFLAGSLFSIFRLIEKNLLSLSMEGMTAVILFLIAQLFVYLRAARIEGR